MGSGGLGVEVPHPGQLAHVRFRLFFFVQHGSLRMQTAVDTLSRVLGLQQSVPPSDLSRNSDSSPFFWRLYDVSLPAQVDAQAWINRNGLSTQALEELDSRFTAVRRRLAPDDAVPIEVVLYQWYVLPWRHV
jgi:hypothetical protein